MRMMMIVMMIMMVTMMKVVMMMMVVVMLMARMTTMMTTRPTRDRNLFTPACWSLGYGFIVGCLISGAEFLCTCPEKCIRLRYTRMQ